MFVSALNHVIEPEMKRQIIGNLFVKIMSEVVGKDTLLVQGTLRPDLIESASALASGSAEKIKTHHNDSEFVRKMRERGLIIEPLKDLHKFEVRELGWKLGLDSRIVERRPFPGPGFSIRVICSDGKESLHAANEVPVKSVGVAGDCRVYQNVKIISEVDVDKARALGGRVICWVGGKKEYKLREMYIDDPTLALVRKATSTVESALDDDDRISQVPVVLVSLSSDGKDASVVIRPVSTRDFMTASPVIPSQKALAQIVSNLLSIGNVCSIFLDLSGKPPATIEWE
jgi:GMP synthase (glutamine-hydrolysing)